jgi:hypothetical protein
MGLVLPTVSVTPGPLYATENNTALTSIDSHDHTSGKGLQVPTAGLNINADLPFAGFNATALRSTRFNSQSATLATGSDLNCLYVVNGNLYYNNASGVAVQVTAGTGVSVSGATVGGVTFPATTGSANQYLVNNPSATSLIWKTPTAPTISKATATGTGTGGFGAFTTGYLFTISTSSTCAAGDTYTNNGTTFTVLAALSAQTGQVLFCSAPPGPTASGTLTRATGSGTSSITFTAVTSLATYTVPVSPYTTLYIRVRMIGGGGGGGGSGTSGGGAGAAGGITAFGAAQALGGGGGAFNGAGGTGGTVSVVGYSSLIALQGGSGSSPGINSGSTNVIAAGGAGAASFFGGGGGGSDNATGNAAIANSGAGGGGGGTSNTTSAGGGGGGGAGGFAEFLISSPASIYYYLVGGTASGGTAGTSGNAGGAGGSGFIEVTEYYS